VAARRNVASHLHRRLTERETLLAELADPIALEVREAEDVEEFGTSGRRDSLNAGRAAGVRAGYSSPGAPPHQTHVPVSNRRYTSRQRKRHRHEMAKKPRSNGNNSSAFRASRRMDGSPESRRDCRRGSHQRTARLPPLVTHQGRLAVGPPSALSTLLVGPHSGNWLEADGLPGLGPEEQYPRPIAPVPPALCA
jgi:hypothetical protein